MQKFLILIIGSVISYLLLRYKGAVKNFTGDFAFAEKYLGSGGTNTFIVIVGILTFVFSLMYVLGTLDTLLLGIFGRFSGAA